MIRGVPRASYLTDSEWGRLGMGEKMVASTAVYSQALTVPCGGIGTSRGVIPDTPMPPTW
jgi:hypothetical protein